MARVARTVSCSEEDRVKLERLSASRTEEARLVERARIVLSCLAGERNDQIAARMHMQAATVALWRNRFLAGGIAALGDLPRPGELGNDVILGNIVGQENSLLFPRKARSTHLYVTGSTGTGKSKFLESLIRQDIDRVHFSEPVHELVLGLV